MSKIFKQILFLGLLALTAQANAQLRDSVVAVIDDGVILRSELDARMQQILQNSNGQTLPPQAELQRLVLDQLILESLQLQMAERSGIRVDDNSLNQTLTQVAQQNNMTFEEFRNTLNRDGQYVNFREQVRRDMMINTLQNGTINQRINITRQEVENYLSSQSAQSDIAPEYRIHHILVPVENPQQNALQSELADILYQQIRDGTDVLELAASGRIQGIAVSGGDLSGWRKVENLPTMFRPVVPAMGVGDVSEPFTSSSGFHIVKLIDRRGGSDLQVNQMHIRHIMIRPNEIRTMEQSETLIHQLYDRIRNGEDFGDIARVYTNDPGSIVSGGDLSWITEGELPPVLDEAVRNAETGELIPPTLVGDAWHIAEVLERRVEDVTEENRRFQAEQILRDRKYDNELENWLTEIRDTAYIDIKL